MTLADFLVMILLGAYPIGVATALGARGALGRGLVAGCGLVGALAGVGLGAVCLGTGTVPTVSTSFLPLTEFALRVDGLSAFFLIVVGVVGASATVYGFGYSAAYEGRYSLRLLGAMLNVLLLSLSVQVMADNALTFLMAWEAMSLSAYAMVLTEHDRPGTVRAAHWYIALTHAGFVALLAMFLLLSGGDLSTSFAGMRSASLTPGTRDAAFVLALLGFGTKAGIAPLHVWLPMAHPVAPSHVSALMSGVVIKMGVYGLLRVTIDLLVDGPPWWGGLVLGAGTVSALLGVLYALMEHDLKRLLAYHSVENIGIIFIGIGAGLMFQSFGLPTLATLGIVAGMYHTINHACFKGLLFLGAGSVVHAMGTRNMEEMGGLIKRMPRTAFFFLLGACAISALPPLNGFASEWLVFQALLGGSAIPQPEVAVVMPIAVAMLALTSGLAAACFVKAFGITFLAIPRSPRAEQAHEAPRSMQAGMATLAVACVAWGSLPFAVVPLLGSSLAGLRGVAPVAMEFTLDPAAAGAGHVRSDVALAPGLRSRDCCWLSFPSRSGCWAPIGGCGWVTRGAAAASGRRLEWSTPRPPSRSRCGASSRSCTGRPGTCPSTSIRTRSTSCSRSSTGARSTPGSSGSSTTGRCRGSTAPRLWVRRLQGGSLHLYLFYLTLAFLILLTAARWWR